jgi:hypothetical protein
MHSQLQLTTRAGSGNHTEARALRRTAGGTGIAEMRRIPAVESTLLERGAADRKWYAEGIGMVKDGRMILVKFGTN